MIEKKAKMCVTILQTSVLSGYQVLQDWSKTLSVAKMLIVHWHACKTGRTHTSVNGTSNFKSLHRQTHPFPFTDTPMSLHRQWDTLIYLRTHTYHFILDSKTPMSRCVTHPSNSQTVRHTHFLSQTPISLHRQWETPIPLRRHTHITSQIGDTPISLSQTHPCHFTNSDTHPLAFTNTPISLHRWWDTHFPSQTHILLHRQWDTPVSLHRHTGIMSQTARHSFPFTATPISLHIQQDTHFPSQTHPYHFTDSETHTHFHSYTHP